MNRVIDGRGPYHWRDGWHFQRVQGGTVEVWQGDSAGPEPGAAGLFIPAPEWASIVAAVSARGETGESYREARDLHDRLSDGP